MNRYVGALFLKKLGNFSVYFFVNTIDGENKWVEEAVKLMNYYAAW